MIVRRTSAVLATTVTGALALASCSGGGSGASDGAVTLTIVESQEIRADAVEALLPGFEAEMAERGTPVTVELVRDIVPDDQFTTKIAHQYTAGEAPDVADYGANNILGFAGAGYLLDLTPYLEEWDEWEAFYPDIKEQVLSPDGNTYALPHEANTQSLFFRRDVLEGLGVSTEQPATPDDLVARLEQITAATGQPSIVLPAGTAWGGGSYSEGFLNVMLGTGSELYDTEAEAWVVESEGLTEAFTLYERLVTGGLLPVEALLDPEPWEATKYTAFVAGDLPVAAQGTWGWRYDWGPEGSAPIDGVLEKVDTWAYPSSSGEPYVVGGVAFSYVVSASTEHPDEAVELIKHLASGEAMAQQLVAVGAAAPRSDLDGVAPYSEAPELVETGRQLAGSRSFVSPEGQEQVSQAVAEATEAILLGEADGPAAAELFAETVTELLGPDRVTTEA